MLCAISITSIQSSAPTLFGLMTLRTLSDRISAPPPGNDSSPVSRNRSSVSLMPIPSFRAMKYISGGERLCSCTSGNSRFIVENKSSYHSMLISGLCPPWMSICVPPTSTVSSTFLRISSLLRT